MPKRSKAELLGLVERIKREYDAGKTTRQIADGLKQDGFDIGKSSVQRSLKTSNEAAEAYKKDVRESQVLMEVVQNTPNTDVSEVAISLMSQKMLKYVKQIDGLEFETPEEFIRSLAQIAQTQARLGKLRMDYTKGFEAAKGEVLKGLADELKHEPELMMRLAQVVATLKPKT